MNPLPPQGYDFGPGPGHWHLDPIHSCLIFVARYLRFGRVQGTFSDAKGAVMVAEDPKESKVDVSIRSASVNTGVQARDDHLRSSDFLDVENHPEIRFTSTRLEERSAQKRSFYLHGDLTIHGITRPITLECQWAGEAPDYADPDGTYGHFFAGNTQIRLSDFGVGDGGPVPWGGRMVGDAVDIVLELRVQDTDPIHFLRQIGHVS